MTPDLLQSLSKITFTPELDSESIILYNVTMQIRRLTYFDYPKIKRLVSYLCTDENDKLAKSIMEEPLGLINAMLPISFKFKSESFIYVEGKEILGLITV